MSDNPSASPSPQAVIAGDALAASTAASILSLCIAVIAIVFRFPRGPLLWPTLILGVAYLLAVLYFYIGALQIEKKLAPLFHATPKFRIRTEFALRCFVITLVVCALGTVGVQQSTADHLYHPLSLGIMVIAQLCYLAWDAFVWIWSKDNAEIRHEVKHFVKNDALIFTASLLVFAAAVAPAETRYDSNGLHPTVPYRVPNLTGMTIATFGAGLYVAAVLVGGLHLFLQNIWAQIKQGHVR